MCHLFECVGEEVNEGEAEHDPQDPAPPQQSAQHHGAGWVSMCTRSDQIRLDTTMKSSAEHLNQFAPQLHEHTLCRNRVLRNTLDEKRDRPWNYAHAQLPTQQLTHFRSRFLDAHIKFLNIY